MTKEASKNIYQRVLSVMGDVDYIQKGTNKVNGMYRFVSHDQVTAKLHPYFVKHGIVVIPDVKSIIQDGNRTSMHITVDFVNADNPTERITINSHGQGIDTGDKGIGKAYSYAYKYALLKTFALETGDDPDNDAQVVHVSADEKKQQEQEEVALQDFLKCPEITDPISTCVYIKGYAKHWSKSILSSLQDFHNKAALAAEVERFKTEHAAKKKKAAA